MQRAASPRPPINRIEIDLSAIRGNFDEVRRRVGPERKIVTVVKADGYGHGALAVVDALAGRAVDYFAAGSFEEAIAVRERTTAPILILGSLDPADAAQMIDRRLIPSLDGFGAAEALSAASKGREVEVFVKVDAGFGRFGIALPRAADFIRTVAGLRGLRVAGVYTHLPFSDEVGRAWAERQGLAFREMIARLERSGVRLPLVQQIASPGLAIALPAKNEAVAIGHLLYGMTVVDDSLGPDMDGLRPALSSIRTRLVHVGERLPGDCAAPYLSKTMGRLGVVPIGIQHGYRPTSQDAFMVIGGAKAPVLRPCLENTIIDLSAVPEAVVGAEAILLGGGRRHAIGLGDLAHWQGTSQLAMLTGLAKSLPRLYVDDVTG